MNSDDTIDQAIRRGERDGLDALGPVEQVVFAISETEVYCDMDGIDNLLEMYGTKAMALFARAFAAVDAVEISNALQAISSSALPVSEELLSHANRLITERHQYRYESIRAFVERSI